MAGPRSQPKRGVSDGQSNEPAPKRPVKTQVAGKPPTYTVNNTIFRTLGNRWENLPPFVGDEDKLYRWIAEPALWGRIIMGGEGGHEMRTTQRIVGLHAALHDGLDASGFVLWRTFHPKRQPLSVTVKSSQEIRIPTQRMQLPNVTIRQQKLQPSSRFGEGWEIRSHVGPPTSPSTTPSWLRSGWRLIQQATFPFLGAPMPVVDAAWTSDRFARTDAITHVLVEADSGRAAAQQQSHAHGASPGGRSGRGSGRGRGDAPPRGRGSAGGGAGSSSDPHDGGPHSPSTKGGCKGPAVIAAAIETPFPAERLLRSLVQADKDDEVLYIDAIVADRYGAAYRLLCDIVAQRQAQHPDRKLVVVLMAVVSSQVLQSYKRWGFSYGGVIDGAQWGANTNPSGAPVLVDRIDRLQAELTNFEQAMMTPNPAPSPTSVVHEGL